MTPANGRLPPVLSRQLALRASWMQTRWPRVWNFSSLEGASTARITRCSHTPPTLRGPSHTAYQLSSRSLVSAPILSFVILSLISSPLIAGHICLSFTIHVASNVSRIGSQAPLLRRCLFPHPPHCISFPPLFVSPRRSLSLPVLYLFSLISLSRPSNSLLSLLSQGRSTSPSS